VRSSLGVDAAFLAMESVLGKGSIEVLKFLPPSAAAAARRACRTLRQEVALLRHWHTPRFTTERCSLSTWYTDELDCRECGSSVVHAWELRGWCAAFPRASKLVVTAQTLTDLGSAEVDLPKRDVVHAIHDGALAPAYGAIASEWLLAVTEVARVSSRRVEDVAASGPFGFSPLLGVGMRAWDLEAGEAAARSALASFAHAVREANARLALPPILRGVRHLVLDVLPTYRAAIHALGGDDVQSLTLTRLRVSALFAPLARFPGVRHLTLYDFETRGDVGTLQFLRSAVDTSVLRSLTLHNAHLTVGQEVNTVVACVPNLEELRVCDCQAFNGTLLHLTPRLRRLELRRTSLASEGMERVAALPALHSLDVRDNQWLRPDALAHLRAAAALRRLDASVSGAEALRVLRDEGVAAQLEHLTLAVVAAHDFGEPMSMPMLRSLHVVSDYESPQLVEACLHSAPRVRDVRWHVRQSRSDVPPPTALTALVGSLERLWLTEEVVNSVPEVWMAWMAAHSRFVEHVAVVTGGDASSPPRFSGDFGWAREYRNRGVVLSRPTLAVAAEIRRVWGGTDTEETAP
jgi:hypothetical protein